MRMLLSSRVLFTLVGVSLPVAAHAADMNKTHIYNPNWPPHAKFHDGQTLSMSIVLGALTTFLAWKPSRNVETMVAGTACAASLYFLTQSTAIFYPGTAYSDSEPPPTMLGLPAAHVIDGVYLSTIAVATYLGLRACRRNATD